MSKDKPSITQKLAELLGLRIRQAREKQELSPGQAAQELNISPAFYDSMESGEALPSPVVLLRISQVLRLSAGALDELIPICTELAKHSEQLARIVQRLAG